MEKCAFISHLWPFKARVNDSERSASYSYSVGVHSLCPIDTRVATNDYFRYGLICRFSINHLMYKMSKQLLYIELTMM